MQAILARGIPNFLMAERDGDTSDLFDTSAFTFREGTLSVPVYPATACARVMMSGAIDMESRQNNLFNSHGVL